MNYDQNIWKRLVGKKSTFLSLLFLSFMVLVSLCAFYIIPDNSHNSNTQHLELALKAPGFKYQYLKKNKNHETRPFRSLTYNKDGVKLINYRGATELINFRDYEVNNRKEFEKRFLKSQTYWLGSDKFGRDILSRLVLGIRLSIFIGLMSVILSLLIGITLGASGGYFGGVTDNIIMYLINITWSIPTLLLVFTIVLALGRGMEIIFVAIGLTLWVEVARLVRGQVLKVKEEEFITAAKSLSYSPIRVISKHILPNIIGPLLVIAATNFAVAILIEAGLSYLGFGIQPPIPSVGNMLHENYGYAISGKPFLALVPAITIMLLVLAFNLVGSGLRDILDVKRFD